ncbi:MAG TPA: beta-ketoacyl-[acyl-carrier-protein] synthase family protein [Spirochaetia bacterium]|jgi:3-oxoacyl-(acyl-carrier-protein) synthase|nr:beta-ketoacyl-[acyl-carrier-protein] synthase family protein [Spirochaetia bacterium]
MSNSKKHRVVVTGLGVIAPNGHGLAAFEAALRAGKSGIRFHQRLADLKFGCQVGGIPELSPETIRTYFTEEQLLALNSSTTYAGIAAIDCWKDAGLKLPGDSEADIDWDTGAIIGTGIGGADTLGDLVVPNVNAGTVRRIGSTSVEQTMSSSVSAKVGGLLALGGQVTTNSSACTTGTEAVIMAYREVSEGRSKRMLAGGAEGHSHYIWAGFDAMRVLGRGFNDRPEAASRPLSASTGGFIPGSGAGVLMIESLESAQARGAKIYCEIIGGAVNSGGQRGKGSMTAPNPTGVRRCIQAALADANLAPGDVEAINGHLTGTMADPYEVENWKVALGVEPNQLPYINATKGMIGHGLGAAGGMECVGAVLQLAHGFLHGSVNCEDLHPALEPYADRIVRKTVDRKVKILAKASFGFGDVNGCVLFQRIE